MGVKGFDQELRKCNSRVRRFDSGHVPEITLVNERTLEVISLPRNTFKEWEYWRGAPSGTPDVGTRS